VTTAASDAEADAVERGVDVAPVEAGSAAQATPEAAQYDTTTERRMQNARATSTSRSPSGLAKASSESAWAVVSAAVSPPRR